MSVFITVSAKGYEELMWRKQQIVDMLKSMDMYVSDCRFQQEAALRSVMPFLKIEPSLEKKSRRNVLTSGAASAYMFTSFEMSDDTGVLLGINRHNNSLCIVDLFNTKKNKNANLNLLGTSGAGKTFTMQLLALRMRMRGIQCFILAPIKGHEFRRACKKIGGEFIKIAPGSPHCINIMEIRHTISPEMELIDEIDYSEMDSMLARKIQQLMTFFSLLIPDMSNEEEQMLDEALIQTYAKFGITHDNDSLYIDCLLYTSSPSEAAQVAATFPDASEGTTLRTVGDGVIEASSDSGNTMWYNSAYYDEPDAPHTIMQSANGVDWYAMQQHAEAPVFEQGEAAFAYNQAQFQACLLYTSSFPSSVPQRPTA